MYALDNTIHSLVYLKQEEDSGNARNTCNVSAARYDPATPRDGTSASASQDLTPLQQQMHQVQVAFIAMQADSATVRTKQQQSVDRQLQQQKAAFELRLREQRNEFDAVLKRLQENFETQLHEQQNAFTVAMEECEERIEEHLSEVQAETALKHSKLENRISRELINHVSTVRWELENDTERRFKKCQTEISAVRKNLETLSEHVERSLRVNRENWSQLRRDHQDAIEAAGEARKKLKDDILDTVFSSLFATVVIVVVLANIFTTKTMGTMRESGL